MGRGFEEDDEDVAAPVQEGPSQNAWLRASDGIRIELPFAMGKRVRQGGSMSFDSGARGVPSLFEPLQLGAVLLPHRILMAPLTAQDIAHGATEGVGPRELRPFYRGLIVSAGGFTAESGQRALAEGWADAIAFGVPFLANPDLPERFRRGATLNAPDENTFYASGPVGYTDYPAL